jgi:hypothetical protein
MFSNLDRFILHRVPEIMENNNSLHTDVQCEILGTSIARAVFLLAP